MFRIDPPLKSRKGVLVSLFQCGNLEFAECLCFNSDVWSPLEFFRFCFLEMEAFATGARERACIPSYAIRNNGRVCPESYWGFARMRNGCFELSDMGYAVGRDERRFNSEPADWWRDIPEAADDPNEVWGTVGPNEITDWLEIYRPLFARANAGLDGVHAEISHVHGDLLLSFPLEAGERFGYCALRLPGESCITYFRCSLSRFSPSAYADHWRSVFCHLLDCVAGRFFLVLDVDGGMRPVRGIVVEVSAGRRILFSRVVDLAHGDFRYDPASGLFVPADECSVVEIGANGFTNVPADSLERWIYDYETVCMRCAEFDSNESFRLV